MSFSLWRALRAFQTPLEPLRRFFHEFIRLQCVTPVGFYLFTFLRSTVIGPPPLIASTPDRVTALLLHRVVRPSVRPSAASVYAEPRERGGNFAVPSEIVPRLFVNDVYRTFRVFIDIVVGVPRVFKRNPLFVCRCTQTAMTS